MVQFHQTRYVPDHAAIAFAGDITLADARTLVESKLAGLEGRRHPGCPRCRTPRRRRAKLYLIARPASVQTTLLLGEQSMARTNPDYERLNVANRVLGGTMGRLFRHLREEKGYTYGIGSGFSPPQARRRVVRVDIGADGGDRAGAHRPARGAGARCGHAGTGGRTR